jgi:DnaJ-class molecular chaperone
MKTCPDCNGDGVIEKGTDDEQRCPNCGGTGFVPDDDDDNEEVIRTGAGGDAMRHDRGCAASREQAMAEFKAAWERKL